MIDNWRRLICAGYIWNPFLHFDFRLLLVLTRRDTQWDRGDDVRI